MEKVFTHGTMGRDMKVNLRIAKNMDMGFIFGQMEKVLVNSILENEGYFENGK
jgi:hypothetical protein